MTVNEILALDFDDVNKMSRKELAKAVSTLASAANKRLRVLERSGNADSFAYRQVIIDGPGKFSVAGKNQGELKHEFTRAKLFYQRKTSTSAGWKKFLQDAGQRIAGDKKYFTNMTAEERQTFWDAYDRAGGRTGVGMTSEARQIAVRKEFDKELPRGETPAERAERIAEVVRRKDVEAYEEAEEEWYTNFDDALPF